MNDQRECDIVMKGGITSGVVYPLAVWQLSKTYRFRNIGGTSAGAIAATLTAAAEYWRQRKKGTAQENAGFDELRKLPGWLAENENLRLLFQPSRKTNAIFTFVLSLISSKQTSWPRRILNAIFQTVYRIPSFIITVLTLILIAYTWQATEGFARILAITTAGLLGLVLFGILPLIWVVCDLLRVVPRNNYGMCSGMPDSSSKTAPLTEWLADKIDAIAGKTKDKPLTFGDLWRPAIGSRRDSPAAPKKATAQRDINIEMVTTNVTYGRPFTIPFEKDINRFYFDPGELAALFPERIIGWLKDHPRPTTDENSPARRAVLAKRGLLPFPQPQDIPIVVAARMSLSFPVLLSAIPLHGIDWNLPYNKNHPENPTTHRCWFSDGGLSSNFPMQFFDAPIPLRPTFGINLRAFDSAKQESKDEVSNVWMPAINNDIIWDNRNGFDDKGPNLAGFFTAIIDTMQNWNDNLQSQVPGFRDRIVHVFLSPSEGGLNLDMPQDVLTKLTGRGQCAGQLLTQRYTSDSPPGPPQTINWDNHRWVRLRVAAAMLQQFIVDFAVRFNTVPTFGTMSYADLVNRRSGAAPFSYDLEYPIQAAFAVKEVPALADLGSVWGRAAPDDFSKNAPHPMPELQVRPRI